MNLPQLRPKSFGDSIPEIESSGHEVSSRDDLSPSSKALLERGGNRILVDSVEAGTPPLTDEEFEELASEVEQLRLADSAKARERIPKISGRAAAISSGEAARNLIEQRDSDNSVG